MREENGNTKFFHKIVSGRKKRKTVVEIKDSVGFSWKKEENI